MASTELGFLALPQFLKGMPELSILPSLPPLDPVSPSLGSRRRRNREATGDGALVPSSTTGLVVSGGAGLGGGWWGAGWRWRRHWRGLVGRGFFKQKINQDRVLWWEDWLWSCL